MGTYVYSEANMQGNTVQGLGLLIVQSDLIINVELGEVSNLNFVWSQEQSILVWSIEIFDSFECARTVSEGFIQLDSHKIPWSFVHDLADKLDLPSGTTLNLDSVANCNLFCYLLHEIRVIALDVDCRFLLLILRILLQEIFFPFFEVISKLIVVFLTDLILGNR